MFTGRIQERKKIISKKKKKQVKIIRISKGTCEIIQTTNKKYAKN